MPIGFHRWPARYKKLNPPLNLATTIGLAASRPHLLRRPESLATQDQRGSRDCQFLNSREPDPETHNQEKKIKQSPKSGFSSISCPNWRQVSIASQIDKRSHQPTTGGDARNEPRKAQCDGRRQNLIRLGLSSFAAA